jgi:hypothetical protein
MARQRRAKSPRPRDKQSKRRIEQPRSVGSGAEVRLAFEGDSRGSDVGRAAATAEDRGIAAPHSLEPSLARGALVVSSVATAVAVFGALSGLSLTSLEGQAVGPYDPRYALGLLTLASAACVLGAWRRRTRVALPIGLVAAALALCVLEDRTLVAAYHRAIPRPFGLSPDLLMAVAYGALGSATWRGAKLSAVPWLAFVGFAWLVLSPTPVAGSMVPGVSALIGDGVDPEQRFGRSLLPWLHLAGLGLGVSLAVNERFRRRVGFRGVTLVFAAWALATGVCGSEGWHRPLWKWGEVGHVATRCATLLMLATGGALLAHDSAGPARGLAKPLLGALRSRVVLGAVVAFAFVFVKVEGWHWARADENVYFYAAKALGDGVLPYRDYFYAHPPLRVLLPGIVFAVSGFSVWTAHLLPTLATLVSALCVWRIAARVAPGKGRELAGLVALGLFLGDQRILDGSTEMSGVNIATAFGCVGLWCAYAQRPVCAAASLAAAIGVGMVQVWMVPVVALTLWLATGTPRAELSRPTVMTRFALVLCGSLAALLGAGLALGGDRFLTQVFRFHSMKAPTHPGHVSLGANPFDWPEAIVADLSLLFGTDELRSLVENNPLAWLGAVVGSAVALAWLWWSRTHAPDRFLLQLRSWLPLLVGLVGSVVFVALLRERYEYYWVAMIPIPAILAAVGLAGLGHFLTESHSRGRAAIAAVAVLLVLMPTRGVARWGLAHPRSAEAGKPGEVKALDFRTSSPVPSLDGAIASLLYKPYLVRGELEAPVHRHFWSKKKRFSIPQQVADAVVALTPPGRPITGSSTSASLVALLAGRRMALDEVDTNIKVFQTGLRDPVQFWREACAEGVAAVVSSGGYFSERSMRRPNPVSGQFRLAERFTDPWLRWAGTSGVELWVLNEGLDRCQVTMP